MKRKGLVVCGLAAVLSVASLAAQSPASMLPAAIKASGKIKVGVNAIFAPMEFKNPGQDKLVGFDIEFAEAIGKVLGVKIEWDDQKFDQLINSVVTSRVDMVISGLSDTVKRQATVDFIDYFNTGTQVYTTKKNEKVITSLEALSGKTMALSAATDNMTTMEKWSQDNLVAKGKPGIKILGMDSVATARLQMVQGRADASATSPEVLGWLEKQNPGNFVAVGPVLDPGPYGICFKKDNTQLRDAVFAAVKQLMADGTYQKLMAEWKLTPGALTAPVINGGKS